MTYRKIYSEETDAVGHVLIGENQDPFMTIPVKGLLGRRVRITVEIEVSECCEKWRVVSTCRPGVCTILGEDIGAVRFCPECGKKL